MNSTAQADKLISGSPVDLTTNSKLIPKMMGEQIMSNLDKVIEDERRDDNLRLIKFKRHFLNYLFRRIVTRELDGNNKLKDIEPLEEDDNLILYSYFLSQNSNFHFEWSYLLSKIILLEEFLITFRQHINFVCDDITKLIKRISFNDNIQFVIDKYLVIEYFHEENAFDANIDLNYISQLFQCKGNSYKVEIEYKSQRLISLSRYSNIEVEKIAAKIETAMSYMATDESDNNKAVDTPKE